MRLGEAEPQLAWEVVLPELGRKAGVLLGGTGAWCVTEEEGLVTDWIRAHHRKETFQKQADSGFTALAFLGPRRPGPRSIS